MPDVTAGVHRFETRVFVPGFTPLTLSLRAVLADHSREDLGNIHIARRWTGPSTACTLASVVVTCFNQAHYLPDAIQSVLAQTYPNYELIVVDDGSTDNTAAVAASFPGIRYVRQENRGLAGARNAGLACALGEAVVFLDADDRLLPAAVETGVRQLAAHPDCAFVAGRHRMIAFDGRPLWDHTIGPEESDLYRSLLRRNFIAMHAAVMYRRFVFESVGSFDPAPKSTEDYDLYLRIARQYPIAWHETLIAEYRLHGSNMTRSPALVLRSALLALRRQRPHVTGDRRAARACRAGRRFCRQYYGKQLAEHLAAATNARDWRTALGAAVVLLRHYPRGLIEANRVGARAGRTTPANAARPERPPTPQEDSTSSRAAQRIVEAGLVDSPDQVDDVHGRVLEIGSVDRRDWSGGASVRQVDVLSPDPADPLATIVADLGHAHHIPSDTFDCIVARKSLPAEDELDATLRTLYRTLKGGGVLSWTVPGEASTKPVDTALQRAWGQGAIESRRNPIRLRLTKGCVSRRRESPPPDGGGALVLLYHRIAQTSPDPWGLSVTAEHFSEHLNVITEMAHPVHLLDTISGSALKPRSVVVTFDDGYWDNVSAARPLLERYDVPATIFIATGWIGQRAFWWDELARLVLGPATLPPALRLSVGGRVYDWRIASHRAMEGEAAGWRAWQGDPSPRHYLYRSLWELMCPLAAEDRGRVLGDLRTWTGSFDDQRDVGRPMRAEEVQSLAASRLIELGCHTSSHPLLAALSLDAQREEIVRGRQELSELTGRMPTCFAYPYGRRSAYSWATPQLLRDAGFRVACANFEGWAGPTADPYQLPRLHVEDLDRDAFAQRLSRWFGASTSTTGQDSPRCR